ncbi:MAG: hypothetical protein JWL85_486 [Candidatus Saccharibacteria bacterium]|nr:hypothetical protein [Candidatus Saccharibacteria bacterium]
MDQTDHIRQELRALLWENPKVVLTVIEFSVCPDHFWLLFRGNIRRESFLEESAEMFKSVLLYDSSNMPNPHQSFSLD